MGPKKTFSLRNLKEMIHQEKTSFIALFILESDRFKQIKSGILNNEEISYGILLF